jgi:hypothetical protein
MRNRSFGFAGEGGFAGPFIELYAPTGRTRRDRNARLGSQPNAAKSGRTASMKKASSWKCARNRANCGPHARMPEKLPRG